MSTFSDFIKDSSWAVGAQAVSLLTSIVVSFLLPKFVTVVDFGYWQYFLLWASYVGVLHFGFGDGLYLKLGGQYWKDIDRQLWMPRIMLCFLLQLGFSLVIVTAISLMFPSGSIYKTIFIWLSIYLIVENCYKITTLAMMATDQMQYVSKTIIIDKLIMSLAVLSMILTESANACTTICSYVASHAIVFVMVLYKTKPYRYAQRMFSSTVIKGTLSVCGVGIVLMLANIMSIFMVGICRLAVEHYWDIETFSKFSFSITIASFFLVFISQIGYVLFPILKRMGQATQTMLFKSLDFLLTVLPIVSYVFFFAMYYIIKWWLPKYYDSLPFLACTIPFICYETRVCMLYNTYFKNIGAIRQLLTINTVSIGSAILFYWTAIYLHDINAMALGLLISEFLKVWFMRSYLSKKYPISTFGVACFETAYNCAFVAVFTYCGMEYTFGIYAISLALLYILFRKEFMNNIKYIKIEKSRQNNII